MITGCLEVLRIITKSTNNRYDLYILTMNASGELIKNKIIVKKSKDVGRFYNKSRLGKTISGNKLQLDLLEGIFLLGEGKIKIFQEGKEVDFQYLVGIASRSIPRFEIKYLIFKDLRARGHQVKLVEKKIKGVDFYFDKQKEKEGRGCFISAFSERDILCIDDVKILIKKVDGCLWFAIVDEEGDLTYYDVSMVNLKKKNRDHKFSKGTGVLGENRVVVFDDKYAFSLLEKEFFGKPFGNGLQLSFVEALYLLEKDVLEIRNIATEQKISLNDFKVFVQRLQPDIDKRIVVFKDLKSRGLIVKTGFKFGVHFRAYTKKPDETHAEYLVHVVESGFESIWAEISRAVRLAHSVNKEILFARVDENQIDYVKFGRLRP